MDVFLSYSWSCSELADMLENTVSAEPAFHVLRDIHAVGTAESLHKFMNSIRESFCSIALLDVSYLHSKNCIYELISLSKERDFTKRLIPIVMQGTDIFTEQGKDEILQFWKRNKSHSLPFEIGELSHALTVLGDLKCIVYDNKADIMATQCGQAVMDTLYQKVFAGELRPASIMPHKLPLPKQRQLCIDFGTSYTLACVISTDGQPYMVRDCIGEASFPSVIELHNNGTYAIGNAVSTRTSNSSTYVVRSLKRAILGEGNITCGSHHFSVMLLISMIFHSVKRNAEEFFGVEFYDILLSVPVDFHGREIKILESAAKVAGLNVVRAIQESSTASLLAAAHAETAGHKYLLNIDFGGGTLDISAADCSDGVCEILFSLGNRSFGSIDYDNMICQHIISKLNQEYKLTPIYTDSVLYARILSQAEQMKINLDRCEHAIFSVEFANQMGDIVVYTWEMTRVMYAKITHELTDQLKNTLGHARELLKENIPKNETVPIYLTGQGSKLFIVLQLIQDMFLGSPIIDCYQESAVCQGLVHQSGVLSGVIKNRLLLDNLHSYIDISCEHYDDKKNIIYIDSINNNYYRLIDPIKGSNGFSCVTIPFFQCFEISFSSQAMSDGCEVVLFDSCPGNDSRIPVFLRKISAQETTSLKILEIEADANGVITAAIFSEEEYAKKRSPEIARAKNKLRQLQQES